MTALERLKNIHQDEIALKEAKLETIKRARFEGFTWEEIGKAMDMTKGMVFNRYRDLGKKGEVDNKVQRD